jgi:hypothetical protein
VVGLKHSRGIDEISFKGHAYKAVMFALFHLLLQINSSILPLSVLAGPSTIYLSDPLSSPIETISKKMLAKTIFFMAFATLSMAAPQDSGDQNAQTKRVQELRAKGLTCNEGVQGSVICSDGQGGDW